MIRNNFENNLNKVIEDFNFNGNKKYKLIILFGLLGDFDSFEYAINLTKFLDSNHNADLNIFALGIGNKIGKEKFCNFTGFPRENLEVVPDNKIHNGLKVSKGIDIGLGGLINMLLMLSGVNSLKNIKEGIRGYTGDRNSKQIFSELDQIKLLNILEFSGNSFKFEFGDGYLRPFELATFRLKNMIEIIQNWEHYIFNDQFLPQRGASFILNNQNQVIYKYFSHDVLGYSSNMNNPLGFISEVCK